MRTPKSFVIALIASVVGAAVPATASADGSQGQSSGVGRFKLHQFGDRCREDADRVNRSNETNMRRFSIVVDGVSHGKGCKKTIELPPGEQTVVLIPDILEGEGEIGVLDTSTIKVTKNFAVRYEPKGNTTLHFRSDGGADYELKWSTSKKFNWTIGQPLKVEIRSRNTKQVVARGLLEWNENSIGK